MTRSDVAGWLLVASFLLWLPVGLLPARIWTAPLEERIQLIAQHRRRWQVGNLSIACATVALVLGLAALTVPLERSGGGIVVPLSLVTVVLGAGLWLACLAFRVTALTGAAAPASRGALELVSAWVGGLFLSWSVLANAAALGFGVGVTRSGYPSTWCGWAAIALAALIFVQLAVTGDAFPASYHLGPALIGVALLLD